MKAFAPARAWAVAAAVQFIITWPFWLHPSPTPYTEFHGDLYRGWPLIYGLDQGDVLGDEWGPLTTYFHPIAFALDTAAAVACGLPATGLVLWVGRRDRRPGGERA